MVSGIYKTCVGLWSAELNVQKKMVYIRKQIEKNCDVNLSEENDRVGSEKMCKGMDLNLHKNFKTMYYSASKGGS
jgi:hypothetical protein